ncbi:MAG: transporter [Spirochaetota bacterium]
MPTPEPDKGHLKRLSDAVTDGARSGLKTAVWLLSIMVPVSFFVMILRWTGVLSAISELLSPVFRSMDLPGSSALVFLSSLFINLYSAIAVMGELSLSLREVTILAMITLSAHNFLVEIAVLASTGSSAVRMVVLRLVAALAAGFALSLLLPAALADEAPRFGADTTIEQGRDGGGSPETNAEEAGGVEPDGRREARAPFGETLLSWLVSSLLLVVRVALILLALMIGERLLQELGVVRWLGRRLGPLMKVFGLPAETAFLWVVSNTLGLAYGAGVLRREVAEGRLSREHGDLLNHHIAISHSLLEDTLLFLALGVPAFWITIPRLVLAIVSVWERRLERRLTRAR